MASPSAQDTPLPAGFPAAAWEDVLVQLQRELAHLVPDARQVIATSSGHYIQLQQPDLVIDATRAVVDAVRQGELHVDPGALPATGGSSALLVSIGSILTATGIGLRTISRRRIDGIRRSRPTARLAR